MIKSRHPECRVFVGNLDYRTTAHDIRTMFSGFGEVTDVYFPGDKKRLPPIIDRDRLPNEPVNYGCAFVEFRNKEQVQGIHTLSGLKDPHDRTVYISNSDK